MAARDKRRTSEKSSVQLMFNTHNPLAELSQAERAQEEDYFRQLNHELLVALRTKSAEEIEQAIRHYTRMRCPKCGEPLEAAPSLGATSAACPGCGGIWLDKGAWEGRVGPPAHGWLQQLFDRLLASKQARG